MQELERVIDTALHERRPAYITIPYDYGRMPVIGKPVKGLPLADVTSAHSDQVELEAAMKAILAALGRRDGPSFSRPSRSRAMESPARLRRW